MSLSGGILNGFSLETSSSDKTDGSLSADLAELGKVTLPDWRDMS